MANQLQRYHKRLGQFCQSLPDERILGLQNMAWLLLGLHHARGMGVLHITA